jgi:AcrR family transcriptional regulator
MMQVMDEQKRLRILAAATELFAAQPFHKVLLSEVAEAAGVGKGTLYVYFKNKDDLYLSVLSSGFMRLMEQLRHRMSEGTQGPVENLETVVREIVQFAYQNPHLFELMRTNTRRETRHRSQWVKKSMELRSIIESVILQGVRTGEFRDAHPKLTARFIPGLVRSVMIEAAPIADRATLTNHILWFVKAALTSKQKGENPALKQQVGP